MDCGYANRPNTKSHFPSVKFILVSIFVVLQIDLDLVGHLMVNVLAPETRKGADPPK